MKYKAFAWVFILALALAPAGCGERPAAPIAGGPRVTFTLQTAMMDGRMVFVGAGGEIDGVVNPDLVVDAGEGFQITVVNGDGMPHDLAVPDTGLQTAMTTGKGQSASASGNVPTAGTYAYICTVAGHRQAGMEGKLIVREPQDR